MKYFCWTKHQWEMILDFSLFMFLTQHRPAAVTLETRVGEIYGITWTTWRKITQWCTAHSFVSLLSPNCFIEHLGGGRSASGGWLCLLLRVCVARPGDWECLVRTQWPALYTLTPDSAHHSTTLTHTGVITPELCHWPCRDMKCCISILIK